MPVNLQKTDVVIVGLGAVGGVAALPLARAGLNVIGLEAGTWLAPEDFAPDELRNNVRGWPHSVQKRTGDPDTSSETRQRSIRRASHPSDDNAVGGTRSTNGRRAGV